MSTTELWAALCEQNEETLPREETYKGFHLKAAVTMMPQGLSMRISVARHYPDRIHEITDTPAWSVDKFLTAEEALDALMGHGHAIVDGKVPGIDISLL